MENLASAQVSLRYRLAICRFPAINPRAQVEANYWLRLGRSAFLCFSAVLLPSAK